MDTTLTSSQVTPETVAKTSEIYFKHLADLVTLGQEWRKSSAEQVPANDDVVKVSMMFDKLTGAFQKVIASDSLQKDGEVSKAVEVAVNSLRDNSAAYLNEITANLRTLEANVEYCGHTMLAYTAQTREELAAQQADIIYAGHPAKTGVDVSMCDLITRTAQFLFGEPHIADDGLEGDLMKAGLLNKTPQAAKGRG